ncbi:FimD/PapC C-terminal domain-containing protein [Paraburkholderia sp.]|uniref:FimD/PapC C-terminal domain-containing protein n=1 Tax=Paraburkholderia sp. TaxID=1926495 RepID=UPI003C7D9666
MFARGLEDKGSLFVKWGEAGAEQCRIDCVFPKSTGKAGAAYQSLEGRCVPDNEPDTAAANHLSVESAESKR